MRTLTASNRISLIKLASELPPGDSTRKAILSGLKIATVAKKAHRPILSGITLAAYREGNAKMMYLINPEKNNSKFYEILLGPDSSGGLLVQTRWGRLTDAGAGRIDAKDYECDDDREAHAIMAVLVRKRMINGYQDAFKTQPVGQYPIGLSGGAGFGWGRQEITKVIPVLRKIVQDIGLAISEAKGGSVDDVTVALAEVSREMSVLGKSSMAREIEDRLDAPLNRLLGNPRFIVNPDKIISELTSLKNYVSKQLISLS